MKYTICLCFSAGVFAQTPRLFSTTVATKATEKTVLSKLRKKTGFSLIKCKQALQQFDNDITKVGWILLVRQTNDIFVI